jgi:hypothetical protein
METLKLDKQKAKTFYPGASKLEQEILISTFGKECFSGKIIDRCNTYEDFYNEASDAVKKEFMIYSTDQPYLVAEKKLMLIIKLVNFDELNGIEFYPGLKNEKQKKWWPIFHWSSGSGFGFSDSYYYCTDAYTLAGLRLCFAREEDSSRIAKKFIDLYEEYLTIKEV